MLHTILQGSRIDGTPVDIRLDSVVPKGAMLIYTGTDLDNENRLFVKAEPASQAGKSRMFDTELHALREVNGDPRIVSLYATGEYPRADPANLRTGRFLALPLLRPGTDLEKHVEENGPMQAEPAVRMMDDMLAGVQAYHERGIVHRDIKPANIVLDRKGWRLVDPGVSKCKGIAEIVGGLTGTPGYMAPEMIVSNELGDNFYLNLPWIPNVARTTSVDTHSDVYCAGLVAYYALTGMDAYGKTGSVLGLAMRNLSGEFIPLGQTMIGKALPPRLVDVVDSSLSMDYKQRPTVPEFRQGLREV
ncbi:protein kinase [Candidatus Woesearchaeota archaeon]|nr:protein kinase [Candidatus Woesearchaeota archaeon]